MLEILSTINTASNNHYLKYTRQTLWSYFIITLDLLEEWEFSVMEDYEFETYE